jgi:hypothetical protein
MTLLVFQRKREDISENLLPEEGSLEAVCENAGLTGEPTAGGLLNRLPAILADG